MNVLSRKTGQIVNLDEYLSGKPRALRTGEVATLLGVSERLIYKLASEGRVPAFRIGGALRFDPGKLANWLREQMLSKTAHPRGGNGMASTRATGNQQSVHKPDATSVTNETIGYIGQQEKEITATISADHDEELAHLQADGFWGFEKGFHDAEEHRRR